MPNAKTSETKPKPNRKKPTFVIIDGNAIIFRAFFALPPLTDKDGTVVNAVYGFMTALIKVIKDLKPDYLAVAFDMKGPTFRHKMYKEYKANRTEQAPELYAQIPMVQEMVEKLGITLFTLKGYEADDIIGTITSQISDEVMSYIVTGDMDITQLVNESTIVYMPKGSDVKLYDEEAVKEKYGGLTPKQVVDYKGLRGDPSDNIPGVRGIGDKGAIKLLTEYGSVENVLKHIDDQKGAMKTKLEVGQDDAILSKQLATIECNVPMKFKLDDTALQPFDRTTLTEIILQYQFKSLLNQLEDLSKAGVLAGETATEAAAEEEKLDPGVRLQKSKYQLVDTEAKAKQLMKALQDVKEVAFDTETTGLDPMQCELVGFSLSFKKGEAHYIPAKFVQLFKPMFESNSIGKIAHNAKFDMKVLLVTQGITVNNLTYDTLLGSYVLNPGGRGHSLDALAMTEFEYQMMSFKELVGVGKKAIPITDVPIETLAFYAAEDADITWQLYKVLKPRVKKPS